jgi:hypothetical protein
VQIGSGATAVQIVHLARRGSRDIEHSGSAHDDVRVEVLKAAARRRLAAGQGELDLGLERTEPLVGVSGRSNCVVCYARAFCCAWPAAFFMNSRMVSWEGNFTGSASIDPLTDTA